MKREQELMKQQQYQHQRNLQAQMEQQMQRDQRMLDMMLNSQKNFMEQQEKTQQEFAKNLENTVAKDSNKGCGISKKTKCPIWDAEESLESYCERLRIWNQIEAANKSKYLELL